MKPFATIASSSDETTTRQIWEDDGQSSLVILHVPRGLIVDLTNGVEGGKDIAGPPISLSAVESESIDLADVLRMEVDNLLDWSPISFYGYPGMVGNIGVLTPKKEIQRAPEAKGRFYQFATRNANPSTLTEYRGMFAEHGFTSSSKKSSAVAMVVRVVVVLALLLAAFAIINRVVSVMGS